MDNPWVWITGSIAIAAVVALALWLNRGLKFKKNQDGVSLELKGDSAGDPKPQSKVSVGEGLTVSSGGKVGNITGKGGDAGNADVDVLKGAIISGTAGDITGVSRKGKPEND